METINKIELTNESIYPDESILKNVLGNAYSAYSELVKMFTNNEMECEWRYYKDGKAWLCKVQKKKKTIVWMSAWKNYMQICIYFPERQIEGVLNLEISKKIKDKIISTKNVGKSKPCIFEVRTNEILDDISKVMNYKMIVK